VVREVRVAVTAQTVVKAVAEVGREAMGEPVAAREVMEAAVVAMGVEEEPAKVETAAAAAAGCVVKRHPMSSQRHPASSQRHPASS
jgi:hypothetical protein